MKTKVLLLMLILILGMSITMITLAQEDTQLRIDGKIIQVSFLSDNKLMLVVVSLREKALYLKYYSLPGPIEISSKKLPDYPSVITEYIFFKAQRKLVTAFSPSGKKFAWTEESLGYPSFTRICLWDIPSGKKFVLFRDPQEIYSLAFSPDEKLLAVGAGADTTFLLELVPQHYKNRLKQEVAAKKIPLLKREGEILSSQSFRDKKNILYRNDRLYTKKVQQAMHYHAVTHLYFTPDSRFLISKGRATHFWDVNKRKEIPLESYPQSWYSLAESTSSELFSPTGRWIARVVKQQSSNDEPLDTLSVWEIVTP